MLRTSVSVAVILISLRAAVAAEPRAGTDKPGGETRTYEQAKAQLKPRALPEFWIGDVAPLGARFEKLARGKVTTIAKSPGGRPLHLVAYGEREEAGHRANFNSAVGGQDPSAYMDKKARRKPVVYFIGPVHGQEVEGLTGLVNLIQVMETGRDLRGRDQAALRALGERCRLLIVPSGNPDGTARFEPRTLHGMTVEDVYFWGQGTWRDGTIAHWPVSKRVHPFKGPEIGFMGCYFNDDGINPMHDEFFAPMGPEAPAILRTAIAEGPDFAVSLHSHGGPPEVLRPAYAPLEVQEQVRDLAQAVYGLLAERTLPHRTAPPKVEPESGKVPAPFNLTSAVYHASGAASFTLEGPHGLAEARYCQVSLEQILDIQLTFYEALLRFALAGKATLYNGIELPAQWPPKVAQLDREPMPVPYLEHPPAVVPIDVGRQLFVDDFLVAETTLRRTFHQAEYYPGNPVLRPDKPWEQDGPEARAMAFSDGVWHDPADGLMKMWYMSGHKAATAYATSRDGLRWEKPALDVEPGTNIVFREKRDSNTVWLDHRERDPQRRFKMFTVVPGKPKGWAIALRSSPDGIHWSPPAATSSTVGDRTTVFFNPFRDVWVYGLRFDTPGIGRSRAYQEHRDAAAGLGFADHREYPWVTSDRLDPRNPAPEFNNIPTQLYNLDATAYESLLLGLFSVWQGPENGVCKNRGIQKRNEVLLGFSRDGFHWHRPDRRPFAGVHPVAGAWNWGNVQSVGGGCLVVGDRLYFYVSGRAVAEEGRGPWTSTGLAFLRRDGFASLDAAGQEGALTTRPLRFSGRHLFVNVAAEKGELRAEVLDAAGKVIEPFRREQCQAISADKTLTEVRWKAAALGDLRNQPVRFRFYLRNGSLYAFWVSPDARGASHGYVAAGGPGFTGPIDTQGTAAYPR